MHLSWVGTGMLAAAAASGCSGQPTSSLPAAPEIRSASPAEPPPAQVPSDERPGITLLDSPVTGVARVLRDRAALRIDVDSDARLHAICKRISIELHPGWTDDTAIDVIGAALEGSALELESSDDGHVVHLRRDAPRYPGCSTPEGSLTGTAMAWGTSWPRATSYPSSWPSPSVTAWVSRSSAPQSHGSASARPKR